MKAVNLSAPPKSPDAPSNGYREVRVEAERPEYSAATGTLDFRKTQVPTQAEDEFLQSLLAHLRGAKVSAEVGTQEHLVIPLRKRGIDPAVTRQLQTIERRYAGAKFVVRRPDLILEKYGLIIEIDGSVHDSSNTRIKRDSTRDAEYLVLGFRCIVVSNRQVYDSESRALVLRDILTFIAQQDERTDEFKQSYQRRRTATSRARAAFRIANPAFDIGSFKRSGAQIIQLSNGEAVLQWGGYRINLKARAA